MRYGLTVWGGLADPEAVNYVWAFFDPKTDEVVRWFDTPLDLVEGMSWNKKETYDLCALYEILQVVCVDNTETAHPYMLTGPQNVVADSTLFGCDSATKEQLELRAGRLFLDLLVVHADAGLDLPATLKMKPVEQDDGQEELDTLL